MSFADTVQDMRNGSEGPREITTAALVSIATSLETLASEAEPEYVPPDEVDQTTFTRSLFAIMRAATKEGSEGLPVDVVAANLMAQYEIRPKATAQYNGGMPAIAIRP